MYVPSQFRVTDDSTILTFIKQHPFGLLLSVDGAEIHDTHTPFIVSPEGKLIGHIAKVNPQWKSWKSSPQVKVVFTGEHSYISPSYYASALNVPTWNYSAVSATGHIKILDDREVVLKFLDELVEENEEGSAPWTLNRKEEQHMKLLDGIVVFEISLEKVDATFKMNQNKSDEDKNSVIDSLQTTGCPFDHQTASFMSEVNGVDKTEKT